jgi:hypothetical protein
MFQRPAFVAGSAVTVVFSLAAPAKERCADVFGPSLLVENPGKDLPWRIVPDVLLVSALQDRDPLVRRVLAKADDTLVAHAASRVELTRVRDGAICTVRTPARTSRPPSMVVNATVSPSSATADRRVTTGSR